MQRKIFIIFIAVAIIIAAGCGGNYSVDQKNGYRFIENKIKNPENKQLKKIRSKKLKNKYLYYPYFSKNKIVTFYYDESRNKNIGVFDKNLNLLESTNLKKGKGPGEIMMEAAIGIYKDKIYIADLQKKSFEIFDSRLEYHDTVLMNNVVSAMYRNPSEIDINQNGFYFSPTIPYSVINLKFNGELNAKIKSDKNVEENPHRIWGWNYCLLDAYKDNVFVTYPSRSSKYIIRKYDKNLNLIWENIIYDQYKDILKKSYIQKNDGSTQPKGSYKVNDIKVYKDKIYLLRGVGGEQVWNGKHSKYHIEEIEGVNNGFIDVFDSQNGKYLFRIKTEFLNTKITYDFDISNDKFYFYSNVFYLDGNKIDKDSNVLTVAKLK
ncbi:MAG: hypothetical protein FXF47_00525 [Candidatus Mcinerneyibacterium aminivorans]|uniref:6-bladed beta-propeller n=1 Tax=Candidatus Mcinerneyibacterium aminivorans TaxID=2703815 RepID=A0A5D0MKN6_9BACT|nr:MAG: hypothetical protein FXF47_00525 [Candidatus Mcinerneyibacterium aminivorans]